MLVAAVMGAGRPPVEREVADEVFAALELASEMRSASPIAAASTWWIAHADTMGLRDDVRTFFARRWNAWAIYSTGDVPRAIPLLEELVRDAVRVLPEGHEEWLRASNDLGFALRVSGDPNRARRIFEEVLRIGERDLPDDHDSLLFPRHNLALVLPPGDPRAAFLLEQVVAVRAARDPEDDIQLLHVRFDLADIHWSADRYAEAAEEYERVLALLQRRFPPEDQALQIVRRNLGLSYHRLGRAARARDLWEELLSYPDEDFPTELNRLHDRSMLALMTRDAGDLPRARAIQEEVFAAYEELLSPDDAQFIGFKVDLATTRARLGDHRGAEALLRSALVALPPDHERIDVVRSNLAGALIDLRELDEARELLEGVLERREQSLPDTHPALLSARSKLSRLLMEQGDFASARLLLEDALEVLERTVPPDNPDLALTRLNLGTLVEDIERAAVLYREVLAAITPSRVPGDEQVRHARGNLVQALTLGVGDEDELRAETQLFAADLRAWFAECQTLSPRAAQETAFPAAWQVSVLLDAVELLGEGEGELFALAEESRALAAGAASAWSRTDDPKVADLRERALETRRRVQDLAGTHSPPDAVRAAVLERDRVEGELRRKLVASGELPPRVELAALAEALPPGSAAVGYRLHWTQVRARESLMAYVVFPDGELHHVKLGYVPELEALVERWRNALGTPVDGRGFAVGRDEDGDADALGAELRRWVLDPVFALTGDAETLFVCTDGPLSLVPLDALPAANADEPVGATRRILLDITFQRLLGEAPDPTAEPELLALGDVDYGEGESFPELVETGTEAREIAELFRNTAGREPRLLLGAGADVEALRELAPRTSFLHLATHGYFAPEDTLPRDGARSSEFSAASSETATELAPMSLCGLALAGANRGDGSGILTAEEIAGLDLGRCELAVLSACETSVGVRRAGQSVHSLQSALHAAGARSVVTSLWKVDDRWTRRLMELFYTYLWVEEMPRAEALWRAKTDLRREGAAVRDWAAWVLTGDPL